MRSATRAESTPRAGVGDDRGSAAAEFAVALPAVVLVLAVVFGGVQLAGLQLRAADAAADAARGYARGETAGVVASRVAQHVAGAGVTRSDRGDLVCATVSTSAGGLAARFGIRAEASSCALGGGG